MVACPAASSSEEERHLARNGRLASGRARLLMLVRLYCKRPSGASAAIDRPGETGGDDEGPGVGSFDARPFVEIVRSVESRLTRA